MQIVLDKLEVQSAIYDYIARRYPQTKGKTAKLTITAKSNGTDLKAIVTVEEK